MHQKGENTYFVRMHPGAVYLSDNRGNLGRAVSDPPVDNARIVRNAGVNGGRVGDPPFLKYLK